MRLAILFIAFALAACAQHPTRIQGTGGEVSPPPGWNDYCARHPDDTGCQ